ncbi:ATP-dependent zinc metalloprotease FtsH, partial [bacterium]|nr:ATP-dependent zinc metalloprotease FtsH [bacterium]
LPLAVIIAFWIFIMRSMRGGAGGAGRAFSFGKSTARLLTEDRPKITFDDVAGLPEAKVELREIVEFLQAPKKFTRLGGKIPKGALLVGPPGTGKTLLAKAVAGEAEVPFFSISGSDFVEMFVGVGASRVRDLFEQGKANAPCIVFIDELDAVGRMRGAGLGGGHDEREQTLNQLLVEMDGFESNEGVILLAATNRPDVLDTALLRPGRFDRQIMVDLPDLKGRQGILEVSAKKVVLANEVDFEMLARGTPGLSGADLANLVNEAALLAARAEHDSVTMVDFEEAKDKTMLGIERKSRVLSGEELRVTAYHEAGHTLVGWFTPGSAPLHKVTIVPRGHTLGVTYFLPSDDRLVLPKKHWLDELAGLMGGRAAEEAVFNDITTGASSDIRYATEVARSMVCNLGMSEKLGPVSFGHAKRQVFLGREMAYPDEISDKTAELIDSEIRRFVDESLERARTLIRDNKDKLHSLANELLERETLTGEDVEKILGKRPDSETEG